MPLPALVLVSLDIPWGYIRGCSELTAELLEVFKAVAVIAGGVLSGCSGGNDPIAYLGIHGIRDPTLNIAGGRSMRDRFLKNNGCATKTAPEPSNGSKTHIKTVYDCKAGYPVWWIPHDGNHDASPADNTADSLPAADKGRLTWAPSETWSFFTSVPVV